MRKVIVAKGDGIGPEIMDATIKILKASNAKIEFEEIEIGEKIYLSGNTAGIPKDAWDTLRETKLFLKAPITTPQGGGYKSLNVTMRKAMGLYANVRPCKSYHPYITTKHPNMDLVIIRENEEDLYAGIEHQQTDEVVQCLKLISRPGCEKIIRYAFEYARSVGRKKVTCFSKDNIMKQVDGLFHQVYNEIGEEYPDIEKEHWIVDIGAAKVADTPEKFDVIVMQNLYGDIISDVAAQIAGSVGLAGSSNIGADFAMFEAIHGSAPDIAGQDKANPSGLINGAIMLLHHIGELEAATNIQGALLKTIEEGIHTADIYKESSKELVGTKAFTDAVIANLGKKPKMLELQDFSSSKPIKLPVYKRKPATKKSLLGVDLFVDWKGEEVDGLAEELNAIGTPHLQLEMITNRGIKVWPGGFKETFKTDHWRCRFTDIEQNKITSEEIIKLMTNASKNGIDVIKTENLYAFGDRKAFSLGQGQ